MMINNIKDFPFEIQNIVFKINQFINQSKSIILGKMIGKR